RLLAQTLASAGVNVGTDASDSTIRIAAPFIDLTGSFGPLPGAFVRGKRISVPIVINNAGNSPAVGTITVFMTAGTSPTPTGSEMIFQTVPVKLKLSEASSRVYKVKALVPSTLPAGSYLH